MIRVVIILSLLSFSCSKKVVSPLPVAAEQDGVIYLQDSEVNLSNPILEIDSILFRESANVSIASGLDGSKIMYSYGEEDMKEYENLFRVDKTGTLIAKVKNDGYQDSETTYTTLMKVSDIAEKAKVSLSPSASDSYPGAGAESLIDLEKGSLNFRDGNKWLGFQSQKVEVDVVLSEPKEINAVSISTMLDHGSWIFGPKSISIGIDGVMYSLLNEHPTLKGTIPMTYFVTVPLDEKIMGTEIKVIIESMDEIPSWHPGKGTPPWLFIDEIIIR